MLKPTVIFILVISIAGYLYCSRKYDKTVKLEKSAGYHTFFISASWGLGLFVMAYVITSIASSYEWAYTIGSLFRNGMSVLLQDVAKENGLLNLLAVLLVTLFLGYLLPVISNFIADYKDGNGLLNEWKLTASSDDSPEFFTLCFNSLDYKLPIAFTLSNRKVYIGYVLEFGKGVLTFHMLILE